MTGRHQVSMVLPNIDGLVDGLIEGLVDVPYSEYKLAILLHWLGQHASADCMVEKFAKWSTPSAIVPDVTRTGHKSVRAQVFMGNDVVDGGGVDAVMAH